MTIRTFARLCGCNPQTLRYYDRVGLLRPARVDEQSGYRFYDEKQALVIREGRLRVDGRVGGFTAQLLLVVTNREECR